MATLLQKHAIQISKDKTFSWDKMEPLYRSAILIFGIIIILIAIKNDVFFSWEFHKMGRVESLFFRYLLFISGLIFIGSIIFRTFLWFRYRPYNIDKVKSWPKAVVVVPAYNEGDTVYKTICSIAKCNYPKNKLKIITIDDGSTDNTYFFLDKAKKRFPNIVQIIKFEKNKGKRRALYEAYKQSKSSFMITVDSDTYLTPNAIKEVLTPLILNNNIGATTGRIRIWNQNANIFTKMLNANFAMAFDFSRAVQSTFTSVFCLSGAFSAYRVSILKNVIEDWINQKFLKKPCTYGEDRSLTNQVLRTGSGTFYQRSAVSFTIVPESLPKILKMFTRWTRSNIRESIIFSRFMFNSKRKGNRILPFIDFFSIISLIIFHFFWFYYFILSGFVGGNLIIRILAYSTLFSFFFMLYYLRIEGKKDVPYVLVFSLFTTIFSILIYTVAGLTLTTKKWSNR